MGTSASITFDQFKQKVRALGGVWSGRDVYFHKYATHYAASYCPDYPEDSHDDSTITYRHALNAWFGSGPYAKNIPYI